MARLKFNSAGVSYASRLVMSAKCTSISVRDGIGTIQRTIQQDVAARNNIGTRLVNINANLSKFENDIQAICKVCDNASIRYNNAETEIKRWGQLVVQEKKINTKKSNNNGMFKITASRQKKVANVSDNITANWKNSILDKGTSFFKKTVGKVGFLGGVTEVVADFVDGVKENSKAKVGKAAAKGGKVFSTFVGDLAANAYKPAESQDWKKAFIGDWESHTLLKNLKETTSPISKIKSFGGKWWESFKRENLAYSFKNAETIGDKIKVGTKWAGVALSAVSNGIDNVEEHGEMNGRAVAETIGETVSDVVVGAAVTATVVGAAAAIGVSAPAVVVGVIAAGVTWGLDEVVKATTGKRNTSELISDTVLDIGESIVDGIGGVINNIGVKWKSCFA